MVNKKYVLAVGLVVIFAALTAVAAWRSAREGNQPGRTSSACRNFAQASLQVGEETLAVAVAVTPTERTHGLAGCAEIPEGSGMYFTFDQPLSAVFWMKGMLIPIDIVWIRNGQVIGSEKNVPPPAAGERDEELPHYTAPQPINAVLELPAGDAEQLQIDVGTSVLLQ